MRFYQMINWLLIRRFFSLWLPVALQMGLIFFYSSQPSDSAVLEGFPFSSFVGHLGGYGLLGLLLYRAFNGGFLPWQAVNAFRTLIFGLFYAASDEIHQLFVPGREASLIDILIDFAGLLGAVIFIRWLSLLRVCFFKRQRLK
jgi:VanZ family protein